MIKLEFLLNKLENVTQTKATLIGTALKGGTEKRDVIHLYNKDKQLLAAGLVSSCSRLEKDQLRLEVALFMKISFSECAYAIVYDKQVPKSFFSQDINRLGIVLQGGGMKGAFGVGVIHYLTVANIIKPNRNLTIAAASTGALTSLILAQNKGMETSLAAIKQYTSMKGIEDLLVLKPEVKSKLQQSPFLNDIVQKVINTGSVSFKDVNVAKLLSDKGGDRISSSIRNGLIAGVIAGPVVGITAAVTTAALDTKSDAQDQFKAIKGLFEVPYSLAKITPVLTKLKAGTGSDLFERLSSNKSELRLAVVSVTKGSICYVTEKLELLCPKEGADFEGFDYSDYEKYSIQAIRFVGDKSGFNASKTDQLVGAALASAAFPGLFEPMVIQYTINGVSHEDLFFDGGIKDNLPLEIINRENELKNIIGIYCSPLPNLSSERTVGPHSWVSMLNIAADEMMNEVARMDSHSGRAMNVSDFATDEGSAQVVHIAPNVTTLGLTQVSPYAIRNTIAYGYMRGFDEMFITENREKLTKDQIFMLRNLSDEIYNLYDLLFETGRKLILDSAYRIPVDKNKFGPNDNYRYEFGHKLSSEDRTSYIAFEASSLENYLVIKQMAVDAINRKYELVKSIPQTIVSAQQLFCRDQLNFMLKSFYGDWSGVYDYLAECDWAPIKKQRVKELFKKQLFSGNRLYYVSKTDAIFKNNAAAPNRENDTTNSKVLRGVISQRISRYPELFAGAITDVLPD